MAKKTLSHGTTGSNLLGPGKDHRVPQLPSRSGIEVILPSAFGSSGAHATKRRSLDTDCTSSAIQWPKECQRTFPPDSTQLWLAVRSRIWKKIPPFQHHSSLHQVQSFIAFSRSVTAKITTRISTDTYLHNPRQL